MGSHFYLATFVIWNYILNKNLFSAFLMKENPLNGQKIRVIWPKWKGNPPGLAGYVNGDQMLSYLSSRFNFTYEMVRVTENTMEPSVHGKGFISYLIDGKCDVLMADVTITYKRLAMVDYTLPWTIGQVSFIIPAPDVSPNINAVVKPFQWPVWTFLGISIICVILVLSKVTQQYSSRYTKPKKSIGSSVKHTLSNKLPKNKVGETRSKIANKIFYVFGILLSQGGSCPEKHVSFRIGSGVWVLAAFVFVQAYQSTLFIYVMAPVTTPIINSVHDIAESADINLILRRGGTFEYYFKSSNETLYQKVQKRIDVSPRCVLTSDCLKMIQLGSRNVYIDAKSYLQDFIESDLKKTGKCNYQIAKEDFLSIPLSYALPKNSRYTSALSIGVLEVQQIGLRHHWDLFNHKGSRLGNCRSTYKKPTSQAALNLKNLTGAFIILLVGLSLSLIYFIYENICSMIHYHN